jgi:SAM-dependent methyltransferase
MVRTIRSLARTGRRVASRLISEEPEQSVEWMRAMERLRTAKAIVDLGCGTSPVSGALVGVDAHIDPHERLLGCGFKIDAASMERCGTHFVRTRIDRPLPFKDKQFDVAYSHHAFEHLDDPGVACGEAMRVAKSGIIITPSPFAEMAFGRRYHKWLVTSRGGKLWFFKKLPYEDCPFGECPSRSSKNGEFIVDANTNPFDILLNDGDWYRGRERMDRLSRKLQRHWRSHSLLMETIYVWEGDFEFSIVE